MNLSTVLRGTRQLNLAIILQWVFLFSYKRILTFILGSLETEKSFLLQVIKEIEQSGKDIKDCSILQNSNFLKINMNNTKNPCCSHNLNPRENKYIGLTHPPSYYKRNDSSCSISNFSSRRIENPNCYTKFYNLTEDYDLTAWQSPQGNPFIYSGIFDRSHPTDGKNNNYLFVTQALEKLEISERFKPAFYFLEKILKEFEYLLPTSELFRAPDNFNIDQNIQSKKSNFFKMINKNEQSTSLQGDTTTLSSVLTTWINKTLRINCREIVTYHQIKTSFSLPLKVLCVKWGTLYSHSDVLDLYKAVKQHLNIQKTKFSSYEFICFTDNSNGLEDTGIKIVNIPHKQSQSNININNTITRSDIPGWWSKLSLFKPNNELEGHRCLYFDLDTVICTDFSFLTKYCGPFGLISSENIYCEGQSLNGYNSSIMSWIHNSKCCQVFSNFTPHTPPNKTTSKYTPENDTNSFIYHLKPSRENIFERLSDDITDFSNYNFEINKSLENLENREKPSNLSEKIYKFDENDKHISKRNFSFKSTNKHDFKFNFQSNFSSKTINCQADKSEHFLKRFSPKNDFTGSFLTEHDSNKNNFDELPISIAASKTNSLEVVYSDFFLLSASDCIHRFDHWLEMNLINVDFLDTIFPNKIVDFRQHFLYSGQKDPERSCSEYLSRIDIDNLTTSNLFDRKNFYQDQTIPNTNYNMNLPFPNKLTVTLKDQVNTISIIIFPGKIKPQAARKNFPDLFALIEDN